MIVDLETNFDTLQSIRWDEVWFRQYSGFQMSVVNPKLKLLL